MVLLLTQVSDIGGFIIRLRCDRQNKNMSKQKRNTHTDGAVGTCLQNITWQVFVEHDGIFQTQLEMCCSDVLGHAHPAVCKRCLCGGVMALPETAERRVKPVIHSLCYNRQATWRCRQTMQITQPFLLPRRGPGESLSSHLQEDEIRLQLSDPSNTHRQERLKILYDHDSRVPPWQQMDRLCSSGTW